MNKRGLKGIFLLVVFFIFSILILNLVLGAEIIQTPQQQTDKEKSNAIAGFFTPLVWGIIIVLVCIAILIIIIIFVVKKIAEYFKNLNDTFYQIKGQRVTLALSQGRLPNRVAWWKIWNYGEKLNPPIRLARTDKDGKTRITKPVANYFGDFQSHEGNLYIVFTMRGIGHLWGLIPIKQLLVIPNREKVTIEETDKDGKVNTIEISNIPKADKIVQFNQNEVLLYADSISQAGLFFYPALRTEDNKIIDLTSPIYESIKEVAIAEMLYSQTHLFSLAMKKGINLNPSLQYQVKTSDTNQSVEVPSGTT